MAMAGMRLGAQSAHVQPLAIDQSGAAGPLQTVIDPNTGKDFVSSKA